MLKKRQIFVDFARRLPNGGDCGGGGARGADLESGARISPGVCCQGR